MQRAKAQDFIEPVIDIDGMLRFIGPSFPPVRPIIGPVEGRQLLTSADEFFA